MNGIRVKREEEGGEGEGGEEDEANEESSINQDCKHINSFLKEKDDYDCCEYWGIKCVDGRVTQLVVYNNETITGPIPDSIGNLEKLTGLQITQNINLSGGIPESIGKLVNLKWLHLNGNGISGSIPDSIGNLVNLEYINLSNNKLSGNIPTLEFEKLTNIVKIRLDNNPKLFGRIPNIDYKSNSDYNSECNYNKTSLCYVEEEKKEFCNYPENNYNCLTCTDNSEVKEEIACVCNDGYYGVGYIQCKIKQSDNDIDSNVIVVSSYNTFTKMNVKYIVNIMNLAIVVLAIKILRM